MAESCDRRATFSSFKGGASETNQMQAETIRRKSVEHIRKTSIATQEEEEAPNQNNDPSVTEAEPLSIFVQSKFCRQGSIQYRNAGWKSSHKRTDSTSSNKSNSSGKRILAKTLSQPKIILHQMTSAEQQAHVQQSFQDIADILEFAGIDEDIMQKIRNCD